MIRSLALAACLLAALAATAQAVRSKIVKTTTSQKGKWTATVYQPSISGSSTVVQYANKSLKLVAAGQLALFKKSVAETLKGLDRDMPGPLEFQIQPTFTLLSQNWVCGYWTLYEFMGGAHGMTSFRTRMRQSHGTVRVVS